MAESAGYSDQVIDSDPEIILQPALQAETDVHPSIVEVAGQAAVATMTEPVPQLAANPRTKRASGSSLDCDPTRRTNDSPEEDNIRTYLFEIGEYPLLTKEGEVDLSQAIERGVVAKVELEKATGLKPAQEQELHNQVKDGEAAERLMVQSNLRLVVSIARRYKASNVRLLDVIQEGNLGLMHAVEKFDWRKGFKFSTYATWWIKQYILNGISNTGQTIRLPVRVANDALRLAKAKDKLEVEKATRQDVDSSVVTITDLAAELDWSEETVEDMLKARSLNVIRSLDEPLGDDQENFTLGDLAADPASDHEYEEVTKDIDFTVKIDSALQILDKSEQLIVKLRFGLGGGEAMTLEATAKDVGLTRERIRQIEGRAFSKLRHPANRDALRYLTPYL